jgi:hypothetical protein
MFALAALPEQADEGALMRPRTVNPVLDAVHADPARPSTTAQMAEMAGVQRAAAAGGLPRAPGNATP